MRIRLILAALTLSLTFILSGCDPQKLVVITYKPLANTRKIVSNGVTATAETGIFRIYRVEKISNNDPDAVDFHYENFKAHLKTEKGGKLMWIRRDGDKYYSEQSLEDTFKAGTVSPNLPIYLVFYSDTGEVEPNESWTALKYDTSGGESVLMVQDPPKPEPFYVEVMTSQDLPFVE